MSFALTDSDAEVHKSVEEAMWKLFMKSGSAEVDAKLQTGMQAMLMYPTGLDRARDIFTQARALRALARSSRPSAQKIISFLKRSPLHRWDPFLRRPFLVHALYRWWRWRRTTPRGTTSALPCITS